MLQQIETPPGTAIPEGVIIRSIPATTNNIRPRPLSGNSVLSQPGQEGFNSASRGFNKINSIIFREGPSSNEVQSDYLEDDFKEVGKFANRMRETKALVRKLEAHAIKHPAIGAVVKALRSCNAYIAVKNGEPHGHYSLCRNRHCAVCSVKVREERRQELMGLIDYRSLSWSQSKLKHAAKLAFVTLTMPSYEGWSAKNQLDALKRVWGRFNTKTKWRALFEDGLGGCRSLEIEHNKDKDTYNPHYHLLLEIPEGHSMTSVKDVIRSAWMKSGGGFIRVRKVDKVRGAILEQVKYQTKAFTKSGDVLSNIIKATRGARLFSLFGSWRKERQAAKDHLVRARDARASASAVHSLEEPKPPIPVNLRNGEVATPEDGIYTLDALMVRAAKNDWDAIYLLKWWKYQFALLAYRDKVEKLQSQESQISRDGPGDGGPPDDGVGAIPILNTCITTLEGMVQGKEHQLIPAYKGVIVTEK